MTIRTLACLTIALVIGASMPESATADGNFLLDNCRAAVAALDRGNADLVGKNVLEDTKALLCMGYVNGAIDANKYYFDWWGSIFRQANKDTQPAVGEQLAAQAAKACPPNGFTYQQGVRIVYKFLTDHPERLHQNDIQLVLDALGEAFPCAARVTP